MRHVICIGSAVVDTVFAVDRLPLAPGKNFASSVRQVCGGLAANAAATVSALGGQGVLWSRVGDDPAGRQIVRELAEWGVDTAAVRPVPGCMSPISTVLVDAGGERHLVNHLDPRLFEDAVGIPLADVARADALMCDVRWPAATVPALALARERGIPALIDVEPSAHTIDPRPLELASHVAFARDGLALLTGTTDIADGLRRFARRTGAWLAVTCGGEGVYWLEEGNLRHLPAFPVEVVDTLAAGDVFHGALALALAERQGVDDAVGFAAAAAAVKCTRFGGRDGIPDRADVERLLAV